jgi:hypothetical protein
VGETVGQEEGLTARSVVGLEEEREGREVGSTKGIEEGATEGREVGVTEGGGISTGLNRSQPV